MEVWREIEGFEGYLVSNKGRVKSLKRKTPKILSQFIDSRGYFQVDLNRGNKLVHRLVAKAFIHNSEEKEQVNHIDGDKLNNDVGNLEWMTNQENQIHAIALGLKVNPKGEDAHNAKLIDEDVLEIYNLAHNTRLTQAEIANRYGVSCHAVSKIKTGKNWSHLTKHKEKKKNDN